MARNLQFLLLVVMAVLGCDSPPPPAAQSTTPPATPDPAVVNPPTPTPQRVEKLSITDFLARIKADDKAFKDTLVETSGIVTNVMHNISSDVMLTINEHEGNNFMVCMPKDQDVFGRIVSGQQITVRGKHETGPGVFDAEIVTLGENPAVVFTPELATEWKQDSEGVKTKLDGKPVIFAGEITEIRPDTLMVKDSSGVPAECSLPRMPFDEKFLKSCKVGDKVKLIGGCYKTSADLVRIQMCKPVSGK